MSGDTVTVSVDGKEYVIGDEEKFYIDAVEKGSRRLCIHRTRVPQETADSHEKNNADISEKFGENEKSFYAQLDTVFDMDVNSSKAVITVHSNARLNDRPGMDVVFSGYSVTVSGGKIENERQVFANKKIKKGFISHHLKEALIPVGLIGLILLFMSIFALHGNIVGKELTIGGTKFTYPWSIGLAAVSAGLLIYTAVTVANIFLTAKKYKD